MTRAIAGDQKVNVHTGESVAWPPPVPPSPPASSTTVIARHPATRLTVPVEVDHLRGRETTAIRRRDWLCDEVDELQADRQRHHELLDAVDAAGRHVKELRAALPEERRRRVMARAGGGAKRPHADGDKQVQEAEEAALATVVELIRFCDDAYGRLSPRLTALIDGDSERRHAIENEIQRLEDELRDLRERRRASFAKGEWLAGTKGLRKLAPAWLPASDSPLRGCWRAREGSPADSRA